ncbi:MAG: tetratricopeptide repeat protein, partial [Cyanobacteria bacterium]|nr:tetratricopeptide repeat protein [Cyanobacteriota bacterium]
MNRIGFGVKASSEKGASPRWAILVAVGIVPSKRNSKSSTGFFVSRRRAALAVAVTVSVSSPGLLLSTESAQAADFSRAKRIIVPASAIQRHGNIDTYDGSDTSSGSYGNYGSSYQMSQSSVMGSSSSDYSVSSKSGLVPPPPPIAPSILPPSLVTPTLSSSFQPTSSTSGYQVAEGVSMAGGRPVKQVNADPTRKTSIDRHAAKSKEHKTHSEKSAVSHAVPHANKLLQEGKLEEAQSLLERYHKSFPDNSEIKNKLAETNVLRAKYYLRQDNYAEGANHARQALFYQGSNTEAKSVLSQALKHQGINDLDVNHRLAQGHLLLSQGKLNEAKVEYQQANAIQPSADSHIGLGNVALRAGNM